MKNRTPKEKYDEEMQVINETIAPQEEETMKVNVSKDGIKELEMDAGLTEEEVEELDEECEAVEEAMEEVDKSMGNVKENATSTMDRNQYLDKKINEQRDKILQQFTGGIKKERFTFEQTKIMNKVLEMVKDKKIDDPVLLHLVNKKLDLAVVQAKLAVKTKEAQYDIIKTMSDLADKSIKNRGAAEHYNSDIFLYIQKNPKLIDTKVAE